MKRMNELWRSFICLFFSRSKDVPLLTKKVTFNVDAKKELEAYKAYVHKNNTTMDKWIVATLDDAIYRSKDLNKPENSDSMKGDKLMIKKMSGHPCYNLDLTLPSRYGANECQGTCASPMPGMWQKPCFWSPQASKQCPAFRPKVILSPRLPTKFKE